MPLPNSRQTTYVPRTPIPSDDLNAIQDHCVATAHAVQPLGHRSILFSTADNPREAGDYLYFGASDGVTGDAGATNGSTVGVFAITEGGGECLQLNGGVDGGVRGVWRVSGRLQVRVADATNPTKAMLNLMSSSSAAFASATLVKAFSWDRYSTNDNYDFEVDFSHEFFHDSTADLYLALRVHSSATGDHSITDAGRFSVTQLQRIMPTP